MFRKQIITTTQNKNKILLEKLNGIEPGSIPSQSVILCPGKLFLSFMINEVALKWVRNCFVQNFHGPIYWRKPSAFRYWFTSLFSLFKLVDCIDIFFPRGSKYTDKLLNMPVQIDLSLKSIQPFPIKVLA